MAFGFHWDNTIEEAEVAPGTLGLLWDKTPKLDNGRRQAFRLGRSTVP